jgi:hypothetical protein
MKLHIVPYKKGSESAKLLAQTLTQRLKYRVLRGDAKDGKMNLFWGIAQSKLENFKVFVDRNVPHVPFTENRLTAAKWLKLGHTVLARTVGGQGGSGITVVEPGGTLPDRPMYTCYIKKKKEFRVHVFDGRVIDVQEKRRKGGVETNSLIRNHDNGWVFCHENIVEPEHLRDIAVHAVDAVGLLFGAVDIIWNEHRNQCFVLEVNSAPGLTETTANKYADAIEAGLKSN